MKQAWLIARREYTYNFRRPRYLFTAFGMPLLLIGVYYFLFSTIFDEGGSELKSIGYVDLSGVLEEAGDYGQFQAYQTLNAAEADLLSNALDAYIVIPEDYLTTGDVAFYSTQAAPFGLNDDIQDLLRVGLANSVSHDVSAERLIEPMDLTVYTFDGEHIGDSEEDTLPRLLVPMGFIMVMFIATNTTSQFLMNGIVEEKENRLIELLITSTSISSLMWGKLAGLGGLALTQVATWTVGTYLIASLRSDVGAFIEKVGLQPQHILLFLVLFLMQYVLIAALMLTIGASVTASQEAQQIASVLSLITLAPIMVIGIFFENTNSPLIYLFNLFPLTAPVTLLLRLTILGDVSMLWVGATLLILLISILCIVWLAARIFRLGMLRYGKRLTLKQIIEEIRFGLLSHDTNDIT